MYSELGKRHVEQTFVRLAYRSNLIQKYLYFCNMDDIDISGSFLYSILKWIMWKLLDFLMSLN